MKTLDTFMSRILPNVMTCPEITAQEALLDAAIEFCEKTLILRQTLDPLDTEVGTLEYELFSLSTQESVVYPLQVWFKGQLLEPIAADRIASVQAFRTDVSGYTNIQAPPSQYFWVEPNTLGVYPIPDTSENNVLTVRAAVRPTRSATALNDVLYDNWIDAMAAGTLARLHQMKDQPWASSDRALIQRRYFHECIQRARSEASVGRVRGSLSVKPRTF